MSGHETGTNGQTIRGTVMGHPVRKFRRNSRYAFYWHSLETALVLVLLLDGWSIGLVAVLTLVALVGWAWSLGHLR